MAGKTSIEKGDLVLVGKDANRVQGRVVEVVSKGRDAWDGVYFVPESAAVDTPLWAELKDVTLLSKADKPPYKE